MRERSKVVEEVLEGARRLRLGPKTFEILRHRLWFINDEGARTIARLSGSPVATEVFDMNTGLMDEKGDLVYIDTFISAQATTLTPFVKTLIAEYSDNPGYGPGDTFLTNDPYVSVAHQTCVMVAGPVHYRGTLVGWTGASLHVIDCGGPIPGQVQIGAEDIFGEQPVTAPVKLVEAGKLRKDIERCYVRNSRLPDLLALDLRAKVAASQVVRNRLLETIEEFGLDTVRNGMQDIIDYTELKLRARLKSLPDGEWEHRGYMEWGDKIYQCHVKMIKQADRLEFDFTKTDDQAPAILNCAVHGLHGAVLAAMMTYLCWDIPWSPGGLRRVVKITSREGSLFHARWPAGVSKSTTTSIWEARNLASITLGKLLGASVRYNDRAMAGWQGVKSLEELFGTDRAGPFGGPLLDGMAGGSGALCNCDGIDTGGHTSSIRATIANVESYESRYPILYLNRRQTPDSGGAGTFRGGAGISMMYIVDGVERIDTKILHTFGVEQPESPGMFGGAPSCTNQFEIKRGSNVEAVLASGVIPDGMHAVSGDLEVYPGYKKTYMQRGDVYMTVSQGGGGYGDPVERDPELVAADVSTGLVSMEWAKRAYGVVITQEGLVDQPATTSSRDDIRRERRKNAGAALETIPTVVPWNADQVGLKIAATVYFDVSGESPVLRCRCGYVYGAGTRSPKAFATMVRLPIQSIGPMVNPHFVNGSRFEFREFYCPACMTRIETEVARPSDQFIDDARLSIDWMLTQSAVPESADKAE